jgi:hypothetical protein
MRALQLVVILPLVLPLVAGCSKKADNGPACPEVVDHMVIVMKAGLKGHESVNLGDRQQMITQCEQRKMSPSVRRCLATAKDIVAMSSCRPATGTPPPDRAPQPLPTPPLPTGSAAVGDGAPAGSAGSGAGSGS